MQLSMDIIADELKDILQYARFPGSTGLTITSVRFLREQAVFIHALYLPRGAG